MSRFGQAVGSILQMSSRPSPPGTSPPGTASPPGVASPPAAAAPSPVASPVADASALPLVSAEAEADAEAPALAFCAQPLVGTSHRAVATRSPTPVFFIDASYCFPRRQVTQA